MKRLIIIATLAIGLSLPLILSAQNPPHPNGGVNPSGDNNRVGAGVPIENGTFILITLALAYAGRKIYVMRRPVEE